MSHYNNDVTYNDKWETPENKAALEKLEQKYFDNSYCSPSCPTAWAVEVLALMELLDKELGIERNEQTLRAYYPQGTMVDWFVINPWRGLFRAIRSNFFEKAQVRDRKSEKHEYRSKTLAERIASIWSTYTHPYKYGIKVLTVTKLNPILNKINKPKLRLSQLKEKYGSLTIYFEAPEAFEEWVSQEIRKTELKLAIKGAYYPVESFWDSGTGYWVGNEYNPDTITATPGVDYKGKPEIKVSKTNYRKLMKELGINLEEVKLKAEARAAEKAKQP